MNFQNFSITRINGSDLLPTIPEEHHDCPNFTEERKPIINSEQIEIEKRNITEIPKYNDRISSNKTSRSLSILSSPENDLKQKRKISFSENYTSSSPILNNDKQSDGFYYHETKTIIGRVNKVGRSLTMSLDKVRPVRISAAERSSCSCVPIKTSTNCSCVSIPRRDSNCHCVAASRNPSCIFLPSLPPDAPLSSEMAALILPSMNEKYNCGMRQIS